MMGSRSLFSAAYLCVLPTLMASVAMRTPAAAQSMPPETSCNAAAVRALNREFEADMRRKDLALLDLYTPTAEFTNPDGTTVTGAAPLRALFMHVFAAL